MLDLKEEKIVEFRKSNAGSFQLKIAFLGQKCNLKNYR